MNAKLYRRILCSKNFKAEGKVLREEIAVFIRNLLKSAYHPSLLEGYTSCRLIPLDKNPAIRLEANSWKNCCWFFEQLYNWYNHLSQEETKYGYLVNISRSWLIVKSDVLVVEAKRVFVDEVNITSEGQRHLGAAIPLGLKCVKVSSLQLLFKR